MNPAIYRKWIREALATASPWALPEKALHDDVARLAGGQFDVSEFRRAVEWNLARDYIRSAENPDTDLVEWKLTKLGAAKETE
ncbi:MAG TPA: hypothetical protein PLA50_05210 [Bacteroidia bacterium]|nr:hypothetical protein [Bacteroidia bacterium]